MLKLILFVIVCTTLSTGYSEELNKIMLTNLENSKPIPQYPNSFSIFQGQKRAKPCPRRKNINNEEHWIPSYTSRITQRLYEPQVLQPEALKNDYIRTNNPADQIDLISSGRRSLNPPNNNAIVTNDDDCVDQIGTDVELPGNTANVEQTALKLLQDCLKKKQNLATGSRRSMSDTDDLINFDNSDNTYTGSPNDLLDSDRNNNYPIDSDSDPLLDVASRRNADDSNNNKLTNKLIDPAISTGIAEPSNKYNIPKNGRICYACSTATNPSCWQPNNRTTIKYCPPQSSCVKKSFGGKDSPTVIRDCAQTCDDSSVPGIEPKYKSCKICNKDYCNAAVSISGFNLAIVLFTAFLKYTC